MPAAKKREGFSVSDVLGSVVSSTNVVWLALPAIFSFLFGQGAAKIAQGQSASQFVSILAFFFAPFYQAQYAFVIQTPPGILSSVLGAARRVRR